jgi:hypothetical protein
VSLKVAFFHKNVASPPDFGRREMAGLDLGVLPGGEPHFADFFLFWTLISL